MVDDADALQSQWFEGAVRVGLTAGASAPDVLVAAGHCAACANTARWPCASWTALSETVHFPLPKGLGRQVDG